MANWVALSESAPRHKALPCPWETSSLSRARLDSKSNTLFIYIRSFLFVKRVEYYSKNARTTNLFDLLVDCVSTKIFVVLLHLNALWGILLGLLSGISADTTTTSDANVAPIPIKRGKVCVYPHTYLDGVAPSARASVHSKVTITLTPFFLAMQVTERVAPDDAEGAAVTCLRAAQWACPTKALVSCIVL